MNRLLIFGWMHNQFQTLIFISTGMFWKYFDFVAADNDFSKHWKVIMYTLIQEFEYLWNAEFLNWIHQAFLMSITMMIFTSPIIITTEIIRNKCQFSCYLKKLVETLKKLKLKTWTFVWVQDSEIERLCREVFVSLRNV